VIKVVFFRIPENLEDFLDPSNTSQLLKNDSASDVT
jgi:hypothetical protein